MSKRMKFNTSNHSLLLCLPNEILLEVFLFLPLLHGHFALSLCCKRLQEVSQNPIVWKLLAADLFRRDGISHSLYPQESRPTPSPSEQLTKFPFGIGDGPERVLPIAFEMCDRNWQSVVKRFLTTKSRTFEKRVLLCPYARACIVPEFAEEEPTNDDAAAAATTRSQLLPLYASQFGGMPFLEEGETWPLCPGCRDKLKFRVQVWSGDHPMIESRIGSDTLFQFFLCNGRCNSSSGTITTNPDSFSMYRLVRGVSQKVALSRTAIEAIRFRPEFGEPQAARLVTRWTPKIDFPHKKAPHSDGDEEGEDESGLLDIVYHWRPCPFWGSRDDGKMFGWSCYYYAHSELDARCDRCGRCPMTNLMVLERISGYEPIGNVYFCESCHSDKLKFLCT